MKKWKQFNDECPRCGNEAEVFTSANGEFVYDADNVECFDCGLTGSICVDEDDDGGGVAHVDWQDYED